MRRKTLPLGIFLILAFVLFGRTLQNPMFFDDAVFILQNDWLRWENVSNFFRSFIPVSNLSFTGFRPLVLTSFTVERELFGLTPWVFHCNNIFLHGLNSWLVFLFSNLLFSKVFKKESFTLGWIVGLLFLLHPTQTYLISLVWKRSDLLLALGVFSSLIAFDRWVQTHKRTYLGLGYGGALIAFLSKESALVLPFAVFLMDLCFWKLSSFPKKKFLFLYLPLGALSLLLVWILFLVQPHLFSQVQLQSQSFMPPSLQLDRWTYLQTQLVCFLHYLKLIFFPISLNVFHWIEPVSSLLDLRFWLGMGTFIVWLSSGIFFLSRNSFISFGLFWFVLHLVPSSSFVPLNMLFDEDRIYLGLVGILLLIVWGGAKFWKKSKKKHWKIIPGSLIFFLGFLILAFSVQNFFQQNLWKDPLLFWKQNVIDEPKDPRAFVTYAEALKNRKYLPDAIRAYEKAIQLDPQYGMAYFLLGNLYLENENWKQAKAPFLKAYELNTLPSETATNLGILFAKEKDYSQAEKYFELAFQHNPSNVEAFRNLALAYEEQGKSEMALQALRQALLQDPENTETQLRIAHWLWKYRKDREGAWIFLEDVLKSQPQNPQALQLQKEIQK